MKLPPSFYISNDVVQLAKSLLGKQLVTNIDNHLTAGIITETEAYAGIKDKASHAYGGRRTNRTEEMYHEGGVAYVYLCYGIHFLFNVVTGPKETPYAVLIRGIYPTVGIETILTRQKKNKLNYNVTNGPGKLSKALGITMAQNGLSLNGETVWIEDKGLQISPTDIGVTKRIGIDYAEEDAELPYRFLLNPKFLDKKNAPINWSVK